jgi:replication initiation and membrane attachment protein DnaB
MDAIFGTLPKWLTRKEAPETSHEAGASVDTKTLEKIVYEVIRSHPDGVYI